MAETLTDLRRIQPGDFAVLTDDQTIEDMMESKLPNATDGLSLEVARVLHVREASGLCDWYLCSLKGDLPQDYPPLWLLVKAVDDEFDLRIYWQPDEFRSGRTKGDLIKDELFWFFQQPEDPDNFKPCDLKFSNWIDQNTEKGTTKFDVKGGELHGECRESPRPDGLKQPQPATVVEYITEQTDVEDTELLLLEVGGLDEDGDRLDEGGVVGFFLGSPVQPNDIDLVQQ
jgi:hypothetical protein